MKPWYLRELAASLTCRTLIISKGCITITCVHPATQPEINPFTFYDNSLIVLNRIVMADSAINRYSYTEIVMKKNLIFPIQVLITLLLLSDVTSQITYQLNQIQHQVAATHHSLRIHQEKAVIHHNMRVFKTGHQNSLSHEGAISETYNLKDMGYFFTLHLTVGGFSYNLNIDTGSSDLFIKGEQAAGNPRVKFSCRDCLKNNKKYTISYLDGDLQTYLKDFPVQLGEHKFNQSLLVAYTASPNFQRAEGLVGLSFPQLARNPNPTFLQTLINNKIIDSYSFGVNLNFQKHDRSFISFGKPDPAHFEGTIKQYKIKQGYSYNININGLSIGDGPKLKLSSALFDTGNTCISIPERYTNDILQQFNGKNGNKCAFDLEESAPQFSLLRCVVRDFNVLPSFKIYIGQQTYDIDKDAYMHRCVKDGPLSLCDLYIESVKYNSELFLGDGFFQRYYTFFDLEKRSIGIAKNKEQNSYANMYKSSGQFDSDDRAFFKKLK